MISLTDMGENANTVHEFVFLKKSIYTGGFNVEI